MWTYVVGTQRAIGIGPPKNARLFVICSPVGPYYPSGFKPIALYGTTEYVRAAPGGKSVALRVYRIPFLRTFLPGTGGYKLGANYAPAIVPQGEAAQKGYMQNLWLHGPEHYLTEVWTFSLLLYSSTQFASAIGRYHEHVCCP